MIDWMALIVFILFFVLVTVLGFIAAHWRRGNLNLLDEWGLAGRRFGTVVTWFLLGGDLYSAFTFIAVPAALYTSGALGFFAIPYAVLAYPLIYLSMPKFWTVAKHRGYVTAADFVRERFGSSFLALLVALTGLVATMPYIALQMFGIEVCLAQMGIPIEIALIIAFLILAAYTYTSGLRAPALIALVKDVMILTVMLVTIIYIPLRLGGFSQIFAAAHQQALQNPKFHEILTPAQYPAYVTLVLGSALALFLYPHSLTGILSSKNSDVIKRNAALLPIYTLMLGGLALLGYMAIAVHVKLPVAYKASGAVPALLHTVFPSWFTGFAFAAISIGALVPAAIMSIAAANLFTRNIYREYFRPNCTPEEECNVAKLTSLLVKFGALVFILGLPTTNIINFQLLGGVWILQTLPAVFLGLYTNWFHRWALIAGWAGGMVAGTQMVVSQKFIAIYPIQLGGTHVSLYAGVAALSVNFGLVVVLTLVLRTIGIPAGRDPTSATDYEEILETPSMLP